LIPAQFFLICNSGPDYGPSYNPINLYKVSLQFNTVKFDHIYENHLLGEIEHDLSFCSVQFRGDFYVIKQELLGPDNFKLTLHKISNKKRVEKITEDFVTVKIRFDEAKICSRGIYQDEEDRIIFCSSKESRAGSAPLGCFLPHFQLRLDQLFFQNSFLQLNEALRLR
jgi:hypothetical protein